MLWIDASPSTRARLTVSANPPVETPANDPSGARRISRQIDQAFEEGARLAGSGLPPTDFYERFLAETLRGIDAPAGVVWLRTPQGFLQLQCKHNVESVGLDAQPNGRHMHNELLRVAFQSGRCLALEPFSTIPGGGGGEGPGGMPAGNPTGFVNLLAPIQGEQGQPPVGLLELWLEPKWDGRALRTFVRYLEQMAGFASGFHRNSQSRQATGQEEVWTRLEAFSRAVHSSLNPTEVAYQVANEGRRLVGCDRISVAVRTSGRGRCRVEAVSGADVVEKRSTLVQLLRKLCDAVLAWGEKLVYRGAKDETLPPAVLTALDAYLAESNSNLLVVQPLSDERDKKDPKRARSALVMECFEVQSAPEPLIQRLDVVAPHAASALFNAIELQRIPLRSVLQPIQRVREVLVGNTLAIAITVACLLAVAAVALVIVPYPLKLEATGQLVPKDRQYVYPVREAVVRGFTVNPGDDRKPGDKLVQLFDPELKRKIDDVQNSIFKARNERDNASKAVNSARAASGGSDPLRPLLELARAEADVRGFQNQWDALVRMNNYDPVDGSFWARAPEFSVGERRDHEPSWRVLSSNFKETFTGRLVKPSDPILRVGDVNGPFEAELKIPSKHVGQVKHAFTKNEELDVDLLVKSMPTRTFKGKLLRKDLGGEAVPNKDGQTDAEPVVFSYVRITGPDIAPGDTVPPELRVTGVEVSAKVRCGSYPSGYSLFYGVWEFLFSRVIFQYL
jgi:hypothetical protein